MARAAIIPGNGCTFNLERCMWYGWARRHLEQEGISTALQTMPDPSSPFLRPSPKIVVASESIWLPFMQDTLRCDENTIVIGHSSGAEAAMRSALVLCISLRHKDMQKRTRFWGWCSWRRASPTRASISRGRVVSLIC
jgi:hypothetical protein